MSSGNITKEDLISIIISSEALMDEIIFCEWEAGTHQEKCINIGDPIFEAIQDFKKKKLKEHQEGLTPKVINFDKPRSMLGCYHGTEPYSG